MQNNNKDAHADGKEHDDDIQKSVSPDIHSSSSGALTRKQGDKTKNKDKDITNDFSTAGPSNAGMPNLEDLSHDADDVGAEAGINNLKSIISVSPIPTTRIHKDHPTSQIIGDLYSTTQTRSTARAVRDQELLQFKMQKVWILVDLPYGKRAIGTKWVYRNKKDKRGIVIRNKARLVAQGHTQEEGIEYEEVFAPVARIEAIRLFLAYASFMGFLVYKMDVKSAFLYGTIEEEVYVCQPPGFEDLENPDKVYKVVKALYGLHQAPRAWVFNSPMLHVLRVKIAINSPWMLSKNWLVHKQTAFGKDMSNPFMADNMPKIVWFSTHHITCMKSWLVQKQTAHGKDTSNTLIVDSLLKTIWFLIRHHLTSEVLAIPGKTATGVNTPRSDEDRLKLMELMVFLLQRNVCVEIGFNVARLSKLLLSGKRLGNVTRLQALVDKKRIMITEEVVREILQLHDAEGVICLPNEEIFSGLARMGYEKPSTKLTFYKAFFLTQWKFFIHTILHSLNSKRTSWNEFSLAMASAVIYLSLLRYISPAFTQKVFENMRRVRKGFSRVEIPLFEKEVVTEVAPPIPTPPSPPSPILDTCSALARRVEDDMENVFNQGRKIADMDKDEGIELAVAASTHIPAAKPKILNIAAAPAVSTRRRKGIVIRDPEEELPSDTPNETPRVKDKGKGILIEASKPMKKKDQIEMDAEYARKLQEEINTEHEETYKNIDWNATLDHGMKYDEILPIFQAKFDANIRFLFKSREEMEAEDQEIIKSINETPAQKAAKRRKLSEEAQEAKDLRKRLEIVEDEDDDVFIEAIPLAQKVSIVDYQIVVIDNKPRYKIIRADDTHQLYISFTTLLKNFDREDLETLWRIARDRFSTSKPTNFLDEYLLLTLRTMFEEPDGQDAIWRNQKSVHGLALVKR
nr:putative ribonuclease H-like domain-containing protein [Tanacetum cinerariifolium]